MAAKKISIRFKLKGAPDAWGSGSKGYYYKINSQLGVKIVGKRDKCTPAQTAKAHKEINKRCPGIFPKCYGCVNVTVNGLLRRGVLLEHIEGDLWSDIPEEEWNEKERNRLQRVLRAHGIEWWDDHEGNIIQAADDSVRFIDPAGYVHFTDPVVVTENLQK